jgi:hypothetical protein
MLAPARFRLDGEKASPLSESAGAALLQGVAVLQWSLRWKVSADQEMHCRELL